MSEWEIYLITRLDGVKSFLVLLTMFSGVTAFTLFMAFLVDDFEDLYKRHLRTVKCCIAVCVISFLLWGLIPTTKEFIAIKGIPPLIDGVKDLTPELKKLLLQVFEKGK